MIDLVSEQEQKKIYVEDNFKLFPLSELNQNAIQHFYEYLQKLKISELEYIRKKYSIRNWDQSNDSGNKWVHLSDKEKQKWLGSLIFSPTDIWYVHRPNISQTLNLSVKLDCEQATQILLS